MQYPENDFFNKFDLLVVITDINGIRIRQKADWIYCYRLYLSELYFILRINPLASQTIFLTAVIWQITFLEFCQHIGNLFSFQAGSDLQILWSFLTGTSLNRPCVPR